MCKQYNIINLLLHIVLCNNMKKFPYNKNFLGVIYCHVIGNKSDLFLILDISVSIFAAVHALRADRNLLLAGLRRGEWAIRLRLWKTNTCDQLQASSSIHR